MFVAFRLLKKYPYQRIFALAKLERACIFMKNQIYFLKTSI